MEHFYQNIEGWFDFADLYEEMVKQAKPHAQFVEIGCLFGKSTAFLAVEILNANKGIVLDIVDQFDFRKDPNLREIAIRYGVTRNFYPIFKYNIEPAKEAIRHIRQGEKSILIEMVNDAIENITGKEIGEAAEKGDKVAVTAVNTIARYLGIGLVSLVDIFNPEMIVIGGSVAKLGERLLKPARKLVQERAYPLHVSAVKIVPAQLGDDVGIIGAAVWAKSILK